MDAVSELVCAFERIPKILINLLMHGIPNGITGRYLEVLANFTVSQTHYSEVLANFIRLGVTSSVVLCEFPKL